ncbi:MAG: hypothetical protein ACOYBY_09205 [Dermatophilaceae bacterium]
MRRSSDRDGRAVTSNGTARVGALDRAGDPGEPHGPSGAVVRVVAKILDIGIDGAGPFESSRHVAERARASTSSADAAVDHIVRAHLGVGAAGGFVTGIGGFLTMPLALPANVAEFYLTATRMVAAIACVRGYDVREERIRAAVLLTIVGAEAEDLLQKAGVPGAGGRVTGLVTRRLPGPVLMIVNKALGFRVVNRLLRTGLLHAGRMVPLVGGALSAGLDTYLLKRIADQARAEFPPLGS